MNATAIQNELSTKIFQVDDLRILKIIQTFLDSQLNHDVLSATQKKLINQSEKDILEGNLVEHDFAMEKIANKYGW